MTFDPNDKTLDDPRFQSLLVSCLEALERGESLDEERLKAEYPEFADELGKFLEDRDRLVVLASAVRNGGDDCADLFRRRDCRPTQLSALHLHLT